MTSPARLRHVPALDGLRGLAIAGVLCYHAGFPWARGGFLGVSAFFTLSGFLITSLLLSEHRATGRVDLRAFWARRARRLLPAAYTTLAAVVVFGVALADPGQVRGLRADVLAALGYVANWRFLLDGRSYAEMFAAPSPLQHFWSLAIEEQYYVTFPLLAAGALALGRGRRGLLGATLLAFTAASAVTAVALRGVDRVYFGTDTRASELLVGALLAVVLTGRELRFRPSARRMIDTAGLAALSVLILTWSRTGQGDAWLYAGGLTLHALLTAAVIAACVSASAVPRMLAWPPLRALGRVSYGAYLYHWPVFLFLDGERTGLGRGPLFVARVAATLALASASFVLIEQPVRSRARVTGRWARIAAPAVAAGLAVSATAITASPPPSIVLTAVNDSPPQTPGSERAFSAAAHVVPETSAAAESPNAPPSTDASNRGLHRARAGGRPLRVLVVGDSVGVTLGRGLERAAASGEHVQVWNIARLWCGIGRGAERSVGMASSDASECDDWPEVWGDAVDTFDPDTVVVLSTIWEIVDRRRPQWPDFLSPGDLDYDEWLTSEYVAAADVLGARGARVVWMTLPCLGQDPDWSDRIAHVNSEVLPDLARMRTGSVEVVDLFAKVCPGGEFADDIDGVSGVRPDGVHFSDAGADWTADWLVRMITGGSHADGG